MPPRSLPNRSRWSAIHLSTRSKRLDRPDEAEADRPCEQPQAEVQGAQLKPGMEEGGTGVVAFREESRRSGAPIGLASLPVQIGSSPATSGQIASPHSLQIGGLGPSAAAPAIIERPSAPG